MLQYKCDDQGGPQPPKPWKEGDPKPQPKPGEPGYEEPPAEKK